MLTTADYTKVVSLRVTGTKAAYTEATTTSNEFSVTAGGALQNVGRRSSRACAVGREPVGRAARGRLGEQVPLPVAAQGAPIAGATGRLPGDAGRRGRDLSVTVFASATASTRARRPRPPVRRTDEVTVTGTLKSTG